jgi:hypothetical protein
MKIKQTIISFLHKMVKYLKSTSIKTNGKSIKSTSLINISNLNPNHSFSIKAPELQPLIKLFLSHFNHLIDVPLFLKKTKPLKSSSITFLKISSTKLNLATSNLLTILSSFQIKPTLLLKIKDSSESGNPSKSENKTNKIFYK